MNDHEKEYFLVLTIKAVIIPLSIVTFINKFCSFSHIHLEGIYSQATALISLNVFLYNTSNYIRNNSFDCIEGDNFLAKRIQNPVSRWIQIILSSIIQFAFLILDFIIAVVRILSIFALLLMPIKEITIFPKPNELSEHFILLSIFSFLSIFLLSRHTNKRVLQLKESVIQWSNTEIAELNAKEKNNRKIDYRPITLSPNNWIPQATYFVWKFLIIAYLIFLNYLILLYN